MTSQALQEPAILYLIFSLLDQKDLLATEKVCRTWREIILTNKPFLQVLSLRPRPSLSPETQDPATLDPLLTKVFASFLGWGPQSWDGYRGNAGPWVWLAESNWVWLSESHRGPSLSNYKRFTYPEASWRKMLPWNDPPPTQLQVHIESKETGTIARINFDNESTWLTMGLLSDLVENAWFHGNPWWIARMEIEQPRKTSYTYRGRTLQPNAKVSEEVRKSVDRRPGRINLNLRVDERSHEERTQAREKAVRERRETIRKIEKAWFRPCGTRPRRITECNLHIFTDEFHVEGAKGFEDIEWEEIWTYELEPEEEEVEAVQVPRVSRTKKLLKGLVGRS